MHFLSCRTSNKQFRTCLLLMMRSLQYPRRFPISLLLTYLQVLLPWGVILSSNFYGQQCCVEIAGSLGSFLHASLERIIVSSPVGYNDSSKTVFEPLLDQVLRESMDIYMPFFKALYVRDVTNSYCLLSFCCARSKGKTVEIALGPYIAFINVIGGNVAQKILKDLLSQQIDDARSQACAFSDKPMADGTSEDELDAVSDTALVVCPFYLPTWTTHYFPSS
ncbi:hypothetical protein PsorP6_011611 [Peronosclerospora sorghi]|uniref:Uncharacterized protein n=1 Tax=Peronosclerospora sorghi TaxID=230839 RepID=A0ACC0WLY0_9STRA|nr:hypothetical protein PsorP6_011611 [Peronosclerospora sorghi]